MNTFRILLLALVVVCLHFGTESEAAIIRQPDGTLFDTNTGKTVPGSNLGKINGDIAALNRAREAEAAKARRAMESAYTKLSGDYTPRVVKSLGGPGVPADAIIGWASKADIRRGGGGAGLDTPFVSKTLDQLIVHFDSRAGAYSGLVRAAADVAGTVKGSWTSGEQYTKVLGATVPFLDGLTPPNSFGGVTPMGTVMRISPPKDKDTFGLAVATAAVANRFLMAQASELGGLVALAVKDGKLPASPPALVVHPNGHGKLGFEKEPEENLQGWQIPALRIVEKFSRTGQVNVEMSKEGQTTLAKINQDFQNAVKDIDDQLRKLAQDKRNAENERDNAGQEDDGGSGKGGQAAGGGGGNAKGGDDKGGGPVSQGIAATTLGIPASGGDTSLGFMPSTFREPSSIKGPGYAKNQRYNIPGFAKASGFSRPAGINATTGDTVSSDDGLQVTGSGRAPGGIPAGNSALGELANPGGVQNGFGNVTGAGKGGGSPLGEVPEPSVAYENADGLKNPEKTVDFVAASGDGGDEGGDGPNKNKTDEEEESINMNLALQLMPPVEDMMGKKSIMGYLGYIRKPCRDHRREEIGVCTNPKLKLVAPVVKAGDALAAANRSGLVASSARGIASLPTVSPVRGAIGPKNTFTGGLFTTPKPVK